MEYIVVLLLICYIAFIHYQMNKKDRLIEAMVEKLSKFDSNWDTNHLLTLLEKYRIQHSEPIISRNRLFDEPVLNFLFSHEGSSKIFVHYTKDEYTAKKISKEGLLFSDSFEKTAELVINDSVDLTYKHNIRKYYGKYIVVICIPNEIYNQINDVLSILNKQNLQYDNEPSDKPSIFDDNQDEVFTLPKQFIKGYINYETGITVNNPNFNLITKSYMRQGQLN